MTRMQRPQRRYTPRKTRKAPDDLDHEQAARRCRQIALRLRMCGVAAEGTPLRRRLDATMEIADAHARLTAVIDLADEVRPALPAGVQLHALPPFENWRTR